jgi:hypothetical protein
MGYICVEWVVSPSEIVCKRYWRDECTGAMSSLISQNLPAEYAEWTRRARGYLNIRTTFISVRYGRGEPNVFDSLPFSHRKSCYDTYTYQCYYAVANVRAFEMAANHLEYAKHTALYRGIPLVGDDVFMAAICELGNSVAATTSNVDYG